MRIHVIAIMLLISAAGVFAATGDKPNQMVMPFYNVSSSTKPANCVKGELRHNDLYIFNCNSSHHWRRTAKGAGF